MTKQLIILSLEFSRLQRLKWKYKTSKLDSKTVRLLTEVHRINVKLCATCRQTSLELDSEYQNFGLR